LALGFWLAATLLEQRSTRICGYLATCLTPKALYPKGHNNDGDIFLPQSLSLRSVTMKRFVTLSSLFLLLLSAVLYSQLAAAHHSVPFGYALPVQPAPVAQSANHALSAGAELSNTRQSSPVISDDDGLFGKANTLGEPNLEYVGHIGGATNAVFVQGNYAYIGEGPRLTILDITNPTSPTLVGKTAPMPALMQDIYVSGNYAYIADYDGGLLILQLTEGEHQLYLPSVMR